MLNIMRKSANSFFIKLLLGLLIASFGVWGIGDVFKGRSKNAGVATVGDIPISAQRFKSNLTKEIQRVQQLIGQQMTREQILSMGVGDRLLRQMINSTLLSAGATSMGLYVSEAAILNEIKKNKNFFNDTGVFDRRVFINLLSRSGLSEGQYVESVRQSIEQKQFLSPILNGTKAPDAMIDALVAFAAEKRILDVLRINHNQIKNVPTPTGSELETYYKDNTQNFMAPEYRAFTAVILGAKDIAKTISVNEEDLQTSYDERASEFSTDETRVLKQILLKDEASAKRAAKLLDEGKSLVDASKDVGANTAMSTIGTMTRDQVSALSVDMANAAFGAAKGSHTAPIKTPLGWHVVLVEDIKTATVKPYVDVKGQVSKDLKMSRALDELFKLSNTLEDNLGGGMSFEEAANAMNIKISRVTAVDAKGLNTDGKNVVLPFKADILKEALKLQASGESPLTSSADNSAFFVVRVDSITPSAARPLDTIKRQVGLAWEAQKRTDMAAEIAITAQNRLKSGEALGTIASELGYTSFVTEPFTRNGQGLKSGALPASAIPKAFALAQGEVTESSGTGAHSVIRVKQIIAAKKGTTAALRQALQNQVQGAMQNDLAQQMTQALQTKFPVQINQTVLKELY